MRLASWNWGGRSHAGLVSPDGQELTPLAVADASLGALPLVQSLARGDALPQASGPRLPLKAVQLRAPLPRPLRGLFCVGRNYRAHAAELSASVFSTHDAAKESWPIVFGKVAECVIGPQDAVRLPGSAVSSQIDYESELAVIIGKGGINISRGNAMDHVCGYTIVNDVTARDVQMRHQQWDLGKSFDTFCPMGPWIVTPDECDERGEFLPRHQFGRYSDGAPVLWNHLGFDRAAMQTREEGSVVVEMLNHYRRPLRAGDLAVVMSGLASFTSKVLVFTHFLFEAETGTLAACAEAVGMKFDQKVRKIMSFSAEDQARLAARRIKF